MSTPPKAKLPVIGWTNHRPSIWISRAMASLSQGSRRMRIGVIDVTALSMPAASPARVHSPQPMSPLSAVILTMMSVMPGREIRELTSGCLYGMLTPNVSTLVIFIVHP